MNKRKVTWDNSDLQSRSKYNISSKRRCIGERFLLIWVNTTIDQSNQNYQIILAQLKSIANTVNIFNELDTCVDFLTSVEHVKACLIVDDIFGEKLIPLIHDFVQVHTIYILSNKDFKDEKTSKTWSKVIGVYTEIAPICESLHQPVKQFNQNSIAVSFVPVAEVGSDGNLNQLEPLFMYTQIFKEILLELEYNQQSIEHFTAYCRNGDYGSANNITRFEKEYNSQMAIWWYTYPSFIYSLLNNALRMMESNTIINMAFFIRDLNHQIKELHQQQIDSYDGKSFTVYRGQGLSNSDFEKLQKTKGGLMSFNNFVSTSKRREVSLDYADSSSMNTDTIGILFEMTIDPFVSTIPFANVQDVSYYQMEEAEILFSMHTIFRIGEINKVHDTKPIYRVELKLTSDDDEQLRALTERMREEIGGGTGWTSLSTLLVRVGHFDKAEELHKVLLGKISDKSEEAPYYNNLGYIKNEQGDHEESIRYYEKALECYKTVHPCDNQSMGNCYNNIGSVYESMGEYSKALAFYEEGLAINEKTVPSVHPSFDIFYNNIGSVYSNTSDFSKAILFYKKGLEIREKVLLSNDPKLASSYNNIGRMHQDVGNYKQARLFFEKALDIWQKTLPPTHPDLMISYTNIGFACIMEGEYMKALSFYGKVHEIYQKTLRLNHPDFAGYYNNIGLVYKKMGQYSEALSSYEKALEILQESVSKNHPHLATTYNNMATVYDILGQYSKALSLHEKVLEIRQKTLPSTHPDFSQSYNNIGSVYDNMKDYEKALSYYERSLEVCQKTLSPDHPYVVTAYNNIAGVYESTEENSKAISFYEKALEICQKTLSPDHLDLADLYNNIGTVYNNMEEYSEALSFFEKALKIRGKVLPSTHPDLGSTYNNLGSLYDSMKDYTKALAYYEKTREIFEKSLPSNHSDLAVLYSNIASVYDRMKEYSNALSFYEKTIEIRQQILPPEHRSLTSSYQDIAVVYYNIKDYHKALFHAQQALDILQNCLSPTDSDLTDIQRFIDTVKKKKLP